MKNSVHEYKITSIVRVIDGDTIIVDVDLGFYMTHRVRIRLLDVNAPEIRGVNKEAGLKILALARGYFKHHKDAVFSLNTKKTGKYGRWLGVINREGAESFNDYMNCCIKIQELDRKILDKKLLTEDHNTLIVNNTFNQEDI